MYFRKGDNKREQSKKKKLKVFQWSSSQQKRITKRLKSHHQQHHVSSSRRSRPSVIAANDLRSGGRLLSWTDSFQWAKWKTHTHTHTLKFLSCVLYNITGGKVLRNGRKLWPCPKLCFYYCTIRAHWPLIKRLPRNRREMKWFVLCIQIGIQSKHNYHFGIAAIRRRRTRKNSPMPTLKNKNSHT